MRRKIALVLAAVMVVTIFMPFTVQAASDNFVDNRPSVPGSTLFHEQGVLGTNYLIPNEWGGEAEWYATGTDLVLPIQDRVSNGYTFRLTLNNAEWFFRAEHMPETGIRTTYQALGLMNAAGNVLNHHITDAPLGGAGPVFRIRQATYEFGGGSIAHSGLIGTPNPGFTYDPGRGYYAPIGNGAHGNYYRAVSPLDLAGNNSPRRTSGNTDFYEIPYRLSVSSLNSRVATVTVLTGDLTPGDPPQAVGTEWINGIARNGIDPSNGRSPHYEIRIPLVCLTADDDVDVTVEIDSGNRSAVTSARIIFATSSRNQTQARVDEVAVGRDVFHLEDVIISELRPGTIREGEIIRLSLPRGFHFERNFGHDNTDPERFVRVGLEPGLGWRRTNPDRIESGFGVWSPRPNIRRPNIDYSVYLPTMQDYRDKLMHATSAPEVEVTDELWVHFGTRLRPSDQLRGSVYISNLRIYAEEDTPLPSEGGAMDIVMTIDGEDNITREEIVVARRVDWALSLRTLNTVPTLVSGRFIGPSWSGIDADDNTHMTAKVRMYESTTNAWWARRTTVLSLPETDNHTVKGAKFRKVKVYDTSNLGTYGDRLTAAHPSSMYGLSGSAIGAGVYLNDGERHAGGLISVDEHRIILSNLSVDQNRRGHIDFELWVSIEYGFGRQSGDLRLSVDPSSTSITGHNDRYPSVVIAHVVDPITMTTKVSDLRIGYQYQPTADIIISEVGPGYLLRNKTVRISITDFINSDMWFTPHTRVEVTEGDMRIRNINTVGVGGFTSQSQSWLKGSRDTASISFDIDRESTTASTISITNVAVKLDRTVPVTNRHSYQAVVWGTAIAENFGLEESVGVPGVSRRWRSAFNTPGEFAPYINVISSPDDKGSMLSQEVRVTIGERFYTVNGRQYPMDAAAYISPASNSTMVPVRFVSYAFGFRNENQIIWDDAYKRVTIFAPHRTVQFTLNQSKMVVDGVEITMFSPDKLPVMAEIMGDRMYIPFRALGQAFGVPVTWDEATQTAIYNEGANVNFRDDDNWSPPYTGSHTPQGPQAGATPTPQPGGTPTPTPGASPSPAGARNYNDEYNGYGYSGNNGNN